MTAQQQPTEQPAGADAAPPLKVFVHLAFGQDVEHLRRLKEKGDLAGVGEETPYGYGRADAMGCSVEFSRQAKDPSPLWTAMRFICRGLLGFDYMHARHNAAAALKSDIVWTHTESQFLAMALVFALRGPSAPRPKLLGQSVWFFDNWPRLDPVRKRIYRWLIGYVDILTVHSPENLAVARRLFPDKRAELVRFGIPSENPAPLRRRGGPPWRIIALGNDRHRDWKTAIDAFAGAPDIELRLHTRSLPEGPVKDAPNVTVSILKTNEALAAAFAAADLMIVPLKPNLHASGATALQEGALFGAPMVVTRVGGLDAYFDETEVSYVPPFSPEAMREAARRLLAEPDTAYAQARAAQTRMTAPDRGARRYIEQHVELSRELCAAPATAGR